ncbi:MAG TPA: hypothetical protein DCP47_01440 [Phycisphaerales bacterium]|nr:hypothetical protein [Phycisphaerales bacterium]
METIQFYDGYEGNDIVSELLGVCSSGNFISLFNNDEFLEWFFVDKNQKRTNNIMLAQGIQIVNAFGMEMIIVGVDYLHEDVTTIPEKFHKIYTKYKTILEGV